MSCIGQEPGRESNGDGDHRRRLLRASAIRQQGCQPLRACPEDCFAGGKERRLSAPLAGPGPACRSAEQPFSPSSRSGFPLGGVGLCRPDVHNEMALCFGFPDVRGQGNERRGAGEPTVQLLCRNHGAWGLGTSSWVAQLNLPFDSRGHRGPAGCDMLAADG